MEVEGTDALNAALQRIMREAPEAAARALHTIALDVQNRATQMAPVATGHLRESAYTEFSEDGHTATVGFNATTPDGKYSYALIQHENTQLQHSPPKQYKVHGVTVTGRQSGEAKFLEKAVLQVTADVEARLAEGVQSYVSRL